MKSYIFTDESNTDKARFMLIGGIWVDEETYKKVKDDCKIYKQQIGWKNNTKFNWKKLSKNSFDKYIGFINIFFKYNLKFNCIIIDRKTTSLKYNLFNDEELGFYVFYYMLLQENSLENVDYYVFMDRLSLRRKNILEKIRNWLLLSYEGNNGKKKEIINIKSLDFVNSESFDLIQMSDLLLGAIGFQYNLRHLDKTKSQVKKDFAQYISNKIGKKNLIFDTDKNGYKNFNFWLFKNPLLEKNNAPIPTNP